VLPCRIWHSGIFFPVGLPLFVPPAKGVLLFDFHGLAAAGDGADAPLGDNHLGAALGAAISLAYSICHVYHLFFQIVLTNYKPESGLLSKLERKNVESLAQNGLMIDIVNRRCYNFDT
jgi:hypothetical protein